MAHPTQNGRGSTIAKPEMREICHRVFQIPPYPSHDWDIATPKERPQDIFLSEKRENGITTVIRITHLPNPPAPPERYFGDYKSVHVLEIDAPVNINWVFSLATLMPKLSLMRFCVKSFNGKPEPPSRQKYVLKDCPSVRGIHIKTCAARFGPQSTKKDPGSLRNTIETVDSVLTLTRKYLKNVSYGEFELPFGTKFEQFLQNMPRLNNNGKEKVDSYDSKCTRFMTDPRCPPPRVPDINPSPSCKAPALTTLANTPIKPATSGRNSDEKITVQEKLLSAAKQESATIIKSEFKGRHQSARVQSTNVFQPSTKSQHGALKRFQPEGDSNPTLKRRNVELNSHNQSERNYTDQNYLKRRDLPPAGKSLDQNNCVRTPSGDAKLTSQYDDDSDDEDRPLVIDEDTPAIKQDTPECPERVPDYGVVLNAVQKGGFSAEAWRVISGVAWTLQNQNRANGTGESLGHTHNTNTISPGSHPSKSTVELGDRKDSGDQKELQPNLPVEFDYNHGKRNIFPCFNLNTYTQFQPQPQPVTKTLVDTRTAESESESDEIYDPFKDVDDEDEEVDTTYTRIDYRYR